MPIIHDVCKSTHYSLLSSTHLHYQELKSFRAYNALRAARADSRLVGARAKKSKEGKDDAAPVADKE